MLDKRTVSSKNVLTATALLVTGVATVAYARKKKHAPLATVPYVDVNRYLGQWYEIARLPAPFEKGCTGVTAVYTLREDGAIDVVNTCHKGSVEGKTKTAHGKAFVADKNTNAKLKVQFQWPFRGDYWILDLGENYEYALVGEPSRENLWILSRTPQLDQTIIQRLSNKAWQLGFNTSKLLFPEQF